MSGFVRGEDQTFREMVLLNHVVFFDDYRAYLWLIANSSLHIML